MEQARQPSVGAAAGGSEADLARVAELVPGGSQVGGDDAWTGVVPRVVGEDAAVGLEEEVIPRRFRHDEPGRVLEREAAIAEVVERRRHRRRRDLDLVAPGPAHDAGVAAPGRALTGRVDRLLEERGERGVAAAAHDRRCRCRFERRVNPGLGIEGEAAQPNVHLVLPADERLGGGELLGRRSLPGPVAIGEGDQDPAPDRHAEPVGGADDLQRIVVVGLAPGNRPEVPPVAEVEVERNLVAEQDAPEVGRVGVQVPPLPVRAGGAPVRARNRLTRPEADRGPLRGEIRLLSDADLCSRGRSLGRQQRQGGQAGDGDDSRPHHSAIVG